MATMWRPWTDDQQPQQHTQPRTGTTEREPRRDRGGKGRGKKQGLRNVTNQQVAFHPVPQKYGPSPRLLRGAVATTEVSAAAASEVDPLHTETETETERHRDGWEDRVQQLQERFRDSPKKAIVSALKHTNGHAGKAARLLRSQWSPSALRHVTVLSSEGREETDTARETHGEPATERGQETHRDMVSEDEEDVDDLAIQAGRSIAAASESLQHAVKSWAVTTDTALRAAPVPGTAMQHRDVAVQYTASGLVSAQELHEQARQMVAAQQRLEAELDCLRKRGIEERAELQREHREEIQAWQQKAAALQAEVTALQKARRQQRKQQRTQQREMASLVQTVATRANEASAQLRVRRDLLERGRNGLPRADVDSVAAEHLSDHHGDDGSSSDGDADRLSQQPALDNTAGANSLPDNCAPIGSDRNAQCSSDDDDGVQAGYSSCVEPPEPQVEPQVEPPERQVEPQVELPERQALQESPPNLQCAPPGPSPLQQQSGGEPYAAETPALDQRRRDRRRFLAATEGLPGSMSSSLSALLLYSSPVCVRARSLAGVCDCS